MALLLAVVVIVLLIDRVAFNNSTSPRATGSGIEATQVRSLPPFSALDLTGANNVTVHVGATQSVTVHADDNLIGRITTRVQSGSLLIGNTPGNFSTRAPTIVAVTVPSLGAITLILASISLLACLLPSRAALRIEPAGVLRQE